MSYSQDYLPLEEDTLSIASLQKGKFTIGIGGNLTQEIRKFEDDLVVFVLDEKNNDLFYRINFGYFYADRKAAGLAYRHRRNKFQTTYTSLLGDTVAYAENSNTYNGNVYRKRYDPILGSRRIYLTTALELAYTYGLTDRTREERGQETITKVRAHTLSAGIQIGLLVFPFEGFALEARVGPLGIGYNWENYIDNDVKSTKAENLFINISPRLYMFSFTFSSYF